MDSTVEERNALRFYQGVIDQYEETEDIAVHQRFYQTKRAYNLLNVLMYPGIESEIARFYKEKKQVPFQLLDEPDVLVSVYEHIFSLMCKNMNKQSKEHKHLYRVERIQALRMVEDGHTCSFTSCSLEKSPDDYFMKKDGILLLELDMPLSVPYISVNQILGKNKFSYQEEILLPPFIEFVSERKNFTERELNYRDVNNEVPKGKYNLSILDHWEYSEKNNVTVEDLNKRCEQVKSVLQRIKAEGEVSEAEEIFYCEWKKKFQQLIKRMFDELYYKAGSNDFIHKTF